MTTPRMKRGVGYCMSSECEDYAKGVFLLNHGDIFYCPRCRVKGKCEQEVGTVKGEGHVFKEVRVEYNYDPVHCIYREVGIVRDESLWGQRNVYLLQTPLVKTEKRALKIAESILANLNRYGNLIDGEAIPRSEETLLSWDEPRETYSAKLTLLGTELNAQAERYAASEEK